MTNNDSETSGPDPREEARRWFVRLRQAESARTRRAFEAWLARDPAHAEAFREIEAAWQAAEAASLRIAAREADELAAYLKAMDRRRKAQKRRARRLTMLSIVLALLLLGGIWLERPTLFQDLFADVVTARGERRTVSLPDGSTVLLDADSALAQDFSGQERRIRLLRGAAFFDVVPDGRPFIVTAGSGEMRVLGTRFDVRLVKGGGLVTLIRGRVRVAAGRTDDAELTAGQEVAFGSGGLSAVQGIDPDDATAWHEGRFVFHRARLGDVIEEIGRYRPGRFLVLDQALADERVTGSVLLADGDAALKALARSVGFRLTDIAGLVTVIRR